MRNLLFLLALILTIIATLIMLSSCNGGDGLGTEDSTVPTLFDTVIIDDMGSGADGVYLLETDDNLYLVTPYQESGDIRVCQSKKDIAFICETVGTNIQPEWAILTPELEVISFGRKIINHTTGMNYDTLNSGIWSSGNVIGNLLVAGSQNGTFAIFDRYTGEELLVNKHDDVIMQIDIIGDEIFVIDRGCFSSYNINSYTRTFHRCYISYRLGEVIDSNTYWIANNNPPSIITPNDIIPVRESPKGVAVGDMDNDGILDYVITPTLNKVPGTYFLSQGVEIEIYPQSKKGDNILLYDIDNNGYLDVITTYEVPDIGLVVHLNNGG